MAAAPPPTTTSETRPRTRPRRSPAPSHDVAAPAGTRSNPKGHPAPLAEQLIELAGVFTRSQHQLVLVATEFADSAEWVIAGSPNAARWLADATADVCAPATFRRQPELEATRRVAIDTEVVLHVRGDGATCDDGTPIPETVIADVAPDSFIRALVHDADGRPVNASARQRHPSTRQKRVVRERDRACVDCGRADLLEYDHNPPYKTTRHTVIDELQLRCAPCHRHRHQAA